MIRSLYAPRPNPYYIVAPDYQRTSAGVRVMHMLCDALNRCGYESYVATAVVHPDLVTPQVTQQVVELHKSQGVEPIVVYPEVASGNPIGADVVVRYLLNTPGFLRKIDEFGEDDIMFSFTKGLMLPGMREDNVMFLQPIDLKVFKLSDDPAKRVAGKICYYQGRLGRGIDKSLLPDDAIEITSSYPETWEELVDIFQMCEFFYSSATSALAAEAVLCGCIGVVLPGEAAPLNFSDDETGSFGCSWGLAPEDIDRARRTLPLLRERLEREEAEFWHSLDHFIAVTQQAATDKQQAKRELGAGKRLEKRDLLARELLSTQTSIAGDLPSIGVLLINPEGNAPSLRRSLSSIAECVNAGLAIVPLVIPGVDVDGGGANLIDDINRVASASGCDWLLVMQAGEELTFNGALMTSLQLAKMGSHRAVYADEVTRADHGKFDTALRPDINVDLLLSAPALFGRHWMFRRDLWEQMGKFSADYPEAFEFEFILRLIEVGGSNGLGHIAEPLLITKRPVLVDAPETRQVIERYLRRRGFDGAQVPADSPGRYALDYGHTESPIVSILILLEGQLLHAQRCLDSMLANTSYQQYEIILLDRGNDDALVVDWLAGIEQMGAAQLRVLRFTADSSPVAIRNHGATQARGEFLLFLDSTAGITSRNWLQQLLNHALRPEVGCVGGKLLNGDGRVRHSFTLLGLGGALGDPFAGMGAGESGYMERLQVDQNCAAVSGECLMLRQDLFTSAGGFDTSMASWADQDLCMRLSQAGYLNVWTPRVQVLINDPATPLATIAEQDRLYDRWLPAMVQDPAYNANLSLAAGGGFRLAANAWPMPAAIDEPAMPLVLAHPVKDLTLGQSRLLLPFNALQARGELKGIVSKTLYTVVELQRCNPDVILLQRQLDEDALEAMRRMKTFSTAFKVYELDRYLPDTPKPGFNSGNFGIDILDVLRAGASYMDRVVVPTPMLAGVFESFSTDLRIVESRLDPATWGSLRSLRQVASKPRIGLAIRGAHAADLALLTELIGSLAGSVEWVLIGSCPAHLRVFMHEVHNDLHVAYPSKLSGLNLDLALVPLQSTLANRCKSNEQLLEFGACGVPIICSDLEAHRSMLPVTLVADGAANWMEAVRSHLAEPEAMKRLGDDLQACVRRDWMLEGANLDAWRDAWLAH